MRTTAENRLCGNSGRTLDERATADAREDQTDLAAGDHADREGPSVPATTDSDGARRLAGNRAQGQDRRDCQSGPGVPSEKSSEAIHFGGSW
jgi:hypothetical protein